MEVNTDLKNNKDTFISHVFSTRDEDKAEMLNIIQYALIAIIPVVILNKTIQRFIPEADPDKSSIELLVEISIQLVLIFIGVIIIHRIISYIPTYSGFKYENLSLTNVIIAFLIIVFSIQSKIGMKTNILVDRINILWNGPIEKMENNNNNRSHHRNSQADNLDHPALQEGLFPPGPSVQQTNRGGNDTMQTINMQQSQMLAEPMAANSLLGSSFSSS